MKRSRAIAIVALAMMCFGVAIPAHAAGKRAATKAPAPAAAPAAKTSAVKFGPGEALAKAIVARGMPSGKDNVAVLLPLTGTWDYLESFWTDPKATPEKSMGTVTGEMVLGDHFLSLKSQGTLSVGGQLVPIEVQELIGYDTVKKAFTTVTLDNLTTGAMIGSGTFDDKKHVLTEKGRFTNPLTGTEQAYRAELTRVDADNFKREIFTAGKGGKETKLIEIDYSRRK